MNADATRASEDPAVARASIRVSFPSSRRRCGLTDGDDFDTDFEFRPGSVSREDR